MSQTTCPTPAPETTRALGGPPHLSRTLQVLAVSALTGLPALISSIHAIPGFTLPTWLDHLLAVVSVVALWLSPLYARAAGINAAAAVAEGSVGPGPAATVPPGVGGPNG